MNFEIYIVKSKIDKDTMAAIKEFEKRLSRYSKIKIENFKNDKQLLNKLKDHDFTYSIKPGSSRSSEDFSDWIKNLQMKTSKIVFLIGLETEKSISLSQLTYSEETTALILTEQIYRAFRIMNNEPYHK